MYSKYQIIKILENCFQNMNCFPWIKIIPVRSDPSQILMLRFPIPRASSLTIFVKFYPSQLRPLFNTIPIMFFIDFPILSYPIQPHATTSIGYTRPYGKPSQSNLLSSCILIIIPYGSNTLPIKKLSL